MEPVTTNRSSSSSWEREIRRERPPVQSSAALLSGGRTPPSVMTIDGPQGSSSGGNENSSGASLPRSLVGQARRMLPRRMIVKPEMPLGSRMLHVLGCLPLLPAGWRESVPPPHGSFGCCVNLPLGSRPADPHSTAVSCGNLLHSSPQSRTAVWC